MAHYENPDAKTWNGDVFPRADSFSAQSIIAELGIQIRELFAWPMSGTSGPIWPINDNTWLRRINTRWIGSISASGRAQDRQKKKRSKGNLKLILMSRL